MLNVKMDESTALDLLCQRVNEWRNGEEAELFYRMYENYISCGAFDGGEFDVMQIVDNDIINYCSIIEKGEKDFEKLLKLWKDGERDVSCEDFEQYSVSFIEAVSDDEELILIRH